MIDNITTRLVKLPLTVPALSSVDENGDPMIYLNDRLSSAQQLAAYEHELEHISRDDFYNDLPIEVIEKKTVSKPRRRKAARRPKRVFSPAEAHLAEKMAEIRKLVSPDAYARIADLLSRPARTADEIKLRGWLLYTIDYDDPIWYQILMTFVLYNNSVLPARQSPKAKELTRRTIPYATMKKLIYALTVQVKPNEEKPSHDG